MKHFFSNTDFRSLTACLMTLAALAVAVPGAAMCEEGQVEGAEDFPDPGTTHLGGKTVAIKMDTSPGRPMIDLRVDGRGPYRFVVDTGAGLSVIDAGIAEELGLEVVGTQELRSPGASETIQGQRVQAGRLEAGGLRIDNPVLATMDLAGFSAGTLDGILGRPHFAGLLLTFDFPGSWLVLKEGSLDRADPAVVENAAQAGSIRFPIDMAGVSVSMVLDTGSPGGFTVPQAIQSQLRFVEAPTVGPTIQLVGGVHPTWRATLDGDVRLGALAYEKPEVVLTTISDEFGNIGNLILRDLRVTLDQANSLVRFERSIAAKPDSERVAKQQGPVKIGGPSGKPRLGVAFEMTLAGFVKRHGGIVVRHVDPDSPAEVAGLAIGDIVTVVAGRSLEELGLLEIGGLLRGPRPLDVRILRADRPLEITIE